MLYTTLALLRQNQACTGGLVTLLTSLPKNYKDDKPISLSHIFKSNGLDHAIWALRATTTDSRKTAAYLAIKFAYHCLPNFEAKFPDDKRPRTALEVASDFLDGKATLAEVEAAWSAVAWSAESAASASAWSARSAAWSAARSAESARSAAWSAARSAESAAESASARSAWSAEAVAWSAWSELGEIFLKHIRSTKTKLPEKKVAKKVVKKAGKK